MSKTTRKKPSKKLRSKSKKKAPRKVKQKLSEDQIKVQENLIRSLSTAKLARDLEVLWAQRANSESLTKENILGLLPQLNPTENLPWTPGEPYSEEISSSSQPRTLLQKLRDFFTKRSNSKNTVLTQEQLTTENVKKLLTGETK